MNRKKAQLRPARADLNLALAPTPERPLRTRMRDMPQDTHFEPHQHEWGQLACCGHGLLQVFVQAPDSGHDTSVILPPQRAVWIPPRAMHSIVAIEAAQSRAVYVDPGVIPADWQGVRVVAVSPLLQAVVDAMEQPSYQDNAAAHHALAVLVRHELEHTAELPLGVPLPSQQHGDRRLRTLCEAVLSEPGAHATLADWAGHCGASERTLTRLFRTELGTSFHRWRQQAVLARALPRLAQRVPVSEVAAESGYASESAFSAMFKAAMGVSPRNFRPAAPVPTGAAGTIAA